MSSTSTKVESAIEKDEAFDSHICGNRGVVVNEEEGSEELRKDECLMTIAGVQNEKLLRVLRTIIETVTIESKRVAYRIGEKVSTVCINSIFERHNKTRRGLCLIKGNIIFALTCIVRTYNSLPTRNAICLLSNT